jgi:SNF2 family DNA or RNA helicase
MSHIDSRILETKAYNLAKKAGVANPFVVSAQVVIVSYQFASTKAADLKALDWDLVVIDETHRLRNVYKKSNKIARNLRDAIGHCFQLFRSVFRLRRDLLLLPRHLQGE